MFMIRVFKTKFFVYLFIALFVMGTVFAGAAAASEGVSEKIVWKAASCSLENNTVTKQFLLYIDEVNKRADGEFEIEYVGGPNTIATADLYTALTQGLVNMAMHWPTWYPDVCPVCTTLSLSPYGYTEEVARGLIDLVAEAHEKAGIHLIGNLTPSNTSNTVIFLSKRVEKIADLAGLKIATYAYPVPWIEALGMSPVIMPDSERYLAVERGLADGATWAYQEAVSVKSWEIAPYFLNYLVTRSVNLCITNMDSWNRLPDHLQKLLTDVFADMVLEFLQIRTEQDRVAFNTLLEKGSQPIYLPEAEAEEYVSSFYEAMWDKLINTYPAITPDIRERFLLVK